MRIGVTFASVQLRQLLLLIAIVVASAEGIKLNDDSGNIKLADFNYLDRGMGMNIKAVFSPPFLMQFYCPVLCMCGLQLHFAL